MAPFGGKFWCSIEQDQQGYGVVVSQDASRCALMAVEGLVNRKEDLGMREAGAVAEDTL